MLDTYVEQRVNRSFVVAYSDSDLVPEEYQNMLMGIRDSMTASYFTIGDIANFIILDISEKRYDLPQQRVFDAVGRYCGKSGRTVRYYAETSSFYGSDVREEFETVPFSHFVFARSLAGKWRDVLEFSKTNTGITIESLQAYFLDRNKIREVSHDLSSRQSDQTETYMGNSGEIVGTFALSSGPEHLQTSCELSQDNPYRTRLYQSGILSALSDNLSKAADLVRELGEDRLRDKNEILALMHNLKIALPDIADALA